MQRGALDLPCLAHHQVEVDVVIDGRAHSGVVIQKLVGRYYSIDGVGRFEIGQELLQDLLFRLFPAQVSRVVLDVVDVVEVVECDDTIAGLVQFLERFADDLLAAFRQRRLNNSIHSFVNF